MARGFAAAIHASGKGFAEAVPALRKVMPFPGPGLSGETLKRARKSPHFRGYPKPDAGRKPAVQASPEHQMPAYTIRHGGIRVTAARCENDYDFGGVQNR